MRPTACLAALAAVCAPGCGGEPASQTAASAIEVRADPAGREVVARVDGAPVYADCVATQAEALGLTRQQALDQCIDFELLAQAAIARGYAHREEVLQARRTEIVRRVIDEGVLGALPDPETSDQELLRRLYRERENRYYRPEYRFTVYVRAPAKREQAPPGSQADRAARQLAEAIYAAVADRSDLSEQELYDTATRLAGDRDVELGPPFDFPRHGRAVEEFAAAAFAIPAPGRVSPPVRTQWGWDVILLTKILPEKRVSFEDARPELLEMARVRRYLMWSRALGDDRDIEVHTDALERLHAQREAQP